MHNFPSHKFHFIHGYKKTTQKTSTGNSQKSYILANFFAKCQSVPRLSYQICFTAKADIVLTSDPWDAIFTSKLTRIG